MKEEETEDIDEGENTNRSLHELDLELQDHMDWWPDLSDLDRLNILGANREDRARLLASKDSKSVESIIKELSRRLDLTYVDDFELSSNPTKILPLRLIHSYSCLPIDAMEPSVQKPKVLCVDDEEASDSKIHAEIQPNSHDFRMLIKRENEKLLMSLTQQTGGAVLAANGQNITTLLESYRAKNSESSSSRFTRNKCEFKITPNLTIETRYSKMVEQKSLPSLKRDAYILDSITGQPMKDGGGEFMTTPIDSLIYHTLLKNPDNPEEGTMEVPQESRTDAYRFGSDLIPLGKMDMAGINSAFKSPKSVEMIGYIPSKDVIQSGLTLGPAYALYGGKESNRSMTAVAALAEAMNAKELWGFCRFVKSANGDPRLAVLAPQKIEMKAQSSSESSSCDAGGWYLALLQLPFADDVNVLKPPEVPTEHLGDYNESNICDDLIDSLMIADNELDSTTIPHPALKSYHRMIAHFAMNPITDEEERKEGLSEKRILEACRATPLCELESVKMMSKKATNQIDSFLETFPLTQNNIESKKSERKYWGDGN